MNSCLNLALLSCIILPFIIPHYFYLMFLYFYLSLSYLGSYFNLAYHGMSICTYLCAFRGQSRETLWNNSWREESRKNPKSTLRSVLAGLNYSVLDKIYTMDICWGGSHDLQQGDLFKKGSHITSTLRRRNSIFWGGHKSIDLLLLMKSSVAWIAIL